MQKIYKTNPEKREKNRRYQKNYLQKVKERREAQEKLIAYLQKSRKYWRIATVILAVLFILALCW